MTDVHVTAPMSKSDEKLTTEKQRPLRVLALVDGSQNSGRVTKYLLDLHARGVPFEVVLLNVQPMPETGRLRGYGSFRRTEIDDRLINDLGKRAVTSASRHLGAARIVHKDRIELGDLAPTTVRCAEEEKCDLIVLATSEPAFVGKWLTRVTGIVLPSAAGDVIHLARTPVLVAI